MNFQLDLIKDKVEFFEATSLQELEKKINTQIENNKAIMLRVKSVSHQTAVADGKFFYSAVVHFAAEV
ncbi:YrzA family protein [Bacillus halotolerans]|uniref:YrzA family protein n=1 Tax=Bacillus halotolerans TaxID=260554 RepID=UPI0021F086A4|nr:YrzA family protein [Bacillus halotolerans]UYO30798.1 YrzA family protein [Bacillus halotolerans]